MAHKDDHNYYRSMQKYGRQKHFKALRLAAWAAIAFIILCVVALIVP